MGTSHTVAEFTGKMQNVGRALSNERKVPMPVAHAVEAVMLESAAIAGVVPGGKIHGVRWAGTYVRGVGDKLAVGYRKPAGLANNDTRRHVIGSKRLGSRVRIRRESAAVLAGLLSQLRASRKGRVLHFDGRFAMWVHHPGTRGKRFYERSKAPGAKAAVAALQRDARARVAEVLK